MKEKQIIIIESNKSIWNLVMASILYGISLLLIVSIFFEIRIEYMEYLYYANWMQKIFLLAFILPLAILSSLLSKFHFDLDNLRYKKEFLIGPLSFGKWKSFQSIEYISIYKQSLGNNHKTVLDINLWFKNNKHITISRNSEFDFDASFEIGYQIAKAFTISFLDATADYSQDWYWVSLDKSIDEVLPKTS